MENEEETILSMVESISEIHVEPLVDPQNIQNLVIKDLINRLSKKLIKWERDEVTNLAISLHFQVPEAVYEKDDFFDKLADGFIGLIVRHIEIYESNYPLASRDAIIRTTANRLMLDLRPHDSL